MQLRPYQDTQIYELRNKFNTGKKRVILCSPTGSGKTVTFTELIRLTLSKSDSNRVLVITDRIELFQQTFKTLVRIGIEPTIYNAQVKSTQEVTARVVVAMIETLKRRWKKYGKLPLGKFDLIIIDEAHKGNFKKVFDMYPDAFYIGATATPLATTKRDPLKNYYNDIVNVIDIPELIKDGYLVDEQVFAMMLFDESKLVKDSKKGDFTEKSQFDAFNDKKLFKGLVDAYIEKAIGKKTIVFCPNIAMSEMIASKLSIVNENTFCLTSKNTKEERKQILDQYHESTDGVMVNCGILTTGYDHPPIEVCILFRATESIPLFFQMVGRCSRPSPGKDRMIIIDMGGNAKRIGLWSDSKDWVDLFWNPPKAGNPAPAPTKDCPKCDSMVHLRVMICPYCGHEFKSKEKELIDGRLVELKSVVGKDINNVSVQGLIDLENRKILESKFVYRILRSRKTGLGDLIDYMIKTNKEQGWLSVQMRLPKGVNNFEITEEYIYKKYMEGNKDV
jgi:superfamily II DNA or RNA helicase/DNA-directed RNA polymerase subunit M/transcription elongation factor TFIIS